MHYSIYTIQNTINGKFYIGLTNNIKKRFRQHEINGERGSGSCKWLYRAIKKHGLNNFVFTVIEENITTIECAREREIYYIEKYESYTEGYNANRGGTGGDMSSYQTWNDSMKKLHKNKHSSEYATYGMLGKSHSEKTKEKQANARKVYWDNLTDEERDERALKTKGINNPMFGRTPTNSVMISFRGVIYKSIAEAVRATGHSPQYIKKHGIKL
jgi:group I intron endonuclease